MRSVLALAVILALPHAAFAESAETPEQDEVVIEGVGLSRDIPCNGENIGIYGAQNHIELTGKCGRVIIHGDSHEVTLEQAGELALSGIGHTVFAESTGGLVVETTDHVVTATIASDASPASVIVNGADQTLNLTLASEAQIEIGGFNQVVNWSLAEGAPEPRINASGIGHSVNRVP